MMTSQSVSGHDASESVHSPRDAQYVAVEDDQVVLPVHAAGAALLDQSRTAVRKLVLVTVIALVFMMMEFIGGYIAGSLAVISDAVHMLTDVLGFAIALTAIWIGKRPPSDKLSFGFHRVEVVGALVSIMVIWILTGVLVYSAALRTRDFLKDDAEQVVDGKTMFIIAFIGLAMNVVMMQVLGNDGHGHSHGISVGHSHSHGHGHSHGVDEEDKHAHGRHSHSHGDGGSDEHDHDHNHDLSDNHSAHGDHSDDHGETNPGGDHGEIDAATSQKKMKKKGGLFASKFENLNIQAAYLHVLGDLLQSVGVTIAGAIIWWKPSWQLADPIMTFVFSLLVVGTTTGTVRESILILMEATPRKFQYAEVEMGLKSCREVLAVHDLHIWSLSTNRPALAVHLVSDHPEESLVSAQQYLIAEGITHTTIQIERPSAAYPQQCADEGRCQ